MAQPQHPLDPLSAEEIRTAVALVRTERRLGPHVRFVTVILHEPAKEVVRSFVRGAAVDREAFAVVFDPAGGTTYEAVVSVTAGEVRSWRLVPGIQPAITVDEFIECEEAVKADPAFRAALRKRGVTESDMLVVEAWPVGDYALPEERGRRLAWTPVWMRRDPSENAYARPVEGLIAIVDLSTMEIVRLEDHGVVPLPPTPGTYAAGAVGPLRDDLQPLEVVQPEGPSFGVDGWEVRWQKWRFRIGFSQREGLVLHTIGYEDQGRVRPIVYRASFAELFVPYGDPTPGQYRKNVFDIGEYGLGELTNSLELGCDCLGEIRYFDVDVATSRGNVTTVRNAICMHEEDFGLLWKHFDWQTGSTEVRRCRRLVVSSIATLSNYEYGFFWYLYQDGTIEVEVKLTGVVITSALQPGEAPRHGTLVAPQLNAPNHQHFFSVRLDMAVDGEENTVYEVHTESTPLGPGNPHGNAFAAVSTPLLREHEAQQLIDPLSGRYWKIANPSVQNGLGEPVAYKLVPGGNVLPFAQPGSSVRSRAAFAEKHLWVTPFEHSERYPAGEYPNQHTGGAGLPEWTAANRSIENTDVVLWYTLGSHHLPRPEDWPVMPVQRVGFKLEPLGFFDQNPSLDVSPPHGHGHVHGHHH